MKLAEPTPIEAATQQALELLATAEHRRDEFLRESEAEAERTASGIVDGANRQAKARLEQADLEAARIVVAAGQERARLESALAHERSVVEETRERLSGFLAGMLEEVEATSATSDGPANVRDLNEARIVRTSARADR